VADVLERQLAGEDHAREPQLLERRHLLGACGRRLGRGVELDVGRDGPREARDPEILQDEGVGSRRDHPFEKLRRLVELVRENERVEGQVAPHAAQAQEREQLGQGLEREILRADPGVELGEAEIDRVGAVLDGGPHAFHVAGGGQHFGPGARPHGRGGAWRNM